MAPFRALVCGGILGVALIACGDRSVEGPDLDSPGAVRSMISSFDGVDIVYDDSGEGSPTLIFVHGWSCDRSYWNAQREHFAQHHRVVTIDLPGHGDSGLNRKDWTMHAYGMDVAAVVRELALDEVVLIGHSMGGPVVLEAAALLPDEVIGVVGADTLRDIANRRTEEENAERWRQVVADFPGVVTALVQSMFVPQSDPEQRAHITQDMAAAPSDVAMGAMKGLQDYQIEPGLDAIGAPLVLINSSYQPNKVEPIQALVDDFELKTMDDVGHFVMIDDIPTFNRLLTETIADFTGR